jgi:hypothetical protein
MNSSNPRKGLKYSYIEDEDDDEFNTHGGDEAEQSLVRNNSDLENNNSSIKKVPKKI